MSRARTPIRGVPARPGTARPRRVSEEHGWTHFERTVLEKLEGLEDRVAGVDARVLDIELNRAAEAGERRQRDRVWRWILGIIAAVAVAIILTGMGLRR